ncbi:MAG: radical SAM protein [Syntrophomonadaceae bacterium]|nr:radical SAM protein [Syntrophomonadaceae bacterium]
MKNHVIISFFIPHLGCNSQCVFCNQKTITGYRAGPDPRTVGRVIADRLRSLPPGAECEVAFYGGSFTALPWSRQQLYLEAVQPFINRGEIKSIRVSTRPDAIDGPGLDGLMAYGVRTVELGVQSLDGEVLKASGRNYDASLVENASLLIKEKGLSLGHQLMIGLPASNLAKELETAERVIRIGPDMVRIYPTLVLKGTPLAELYREGRYQPLSLKEAVDTALLLLTQFEKAGIKVIRMGLQPTPELEKSGELLAGPYHPGFGELVQAELFKWQAIHLIERFREREVTNRLKIYVDQRDLSKMIGHNRCNIHSLKARFHLEKLEVIGTKGTEKDWVGVGLWHREAPQMVLSRQSFLGPDND